MKKATGYTNWTQNIEYIMVSFNTYTFIKTEKIMNSIFIENDSGAVKNINCVLLLSYEHRF